jgi:hypothetical protein
MFFHPGPKASVSSQAQQSRIISFKAPPRLVSDQLINIFFQEWAPLFPVLHRPTFLRLYEEYVANPDGMEDKKSLAQLNLVFSIAALSSEVRVGLAFASSSLLTVVTATQWPRRRVF